MSIQKLKDTKLNSTTKTRILVTIAVMAFIIVSALIIRLTPIYAFLSDKIAGSFQIKSAQLSLEVSNTMAQKFVYGEGEDSIYVDSNYIRVSASSVDTDNAVRVADGYILRFKFTIKNTSDVTQDVTPLISLYWAKQPDRESEFFSVYWNGTDGNFTKDDDIYNGNALELIPESDGNYYGDKVESLDPGASTTVHFKILYKRSSMEAYRASNHSAYWGRMKITVGSTSSYPSTSPPNSWQGKSNSFSFHVNALPFLNPKIDRYDLSSDNSIQADNSIAVTCSTITASWNPRPREYKIQRIEWKEDDGKIRADPTGIIVTALSKLVSASEDIGVVTDTGHEFNTDYSYSATSIDDYGRDIGTITSKELPLEGGFVNIPDVSLRDAIKEKHFNYVANSGKFYYDATTYPITQGNFKFNKHEVSFKYPANVTTQIKSIEGLQYAKPFTYYIHLYFDGNDIQSIEGKLPQKIWTLSLNANTNIDDMKTLGKSMDTLTVRMLYLAGMNLESEDITWTDNSGNPIIFTNLNHLELSSSALAGAVPNQITDVSMINATSIPKLGHIGLVDNNVSDITSFGGLKELKHLELKNNKNLKNIANKIGLVNGSAVELPMLEYYGLTSCTGLTSEDIAYVKNPANFYEKCKLAYGGTQYQGTIPNP